MSAAFASHFLLNEDFQPARAHGLHEDFVIALALVGIGNRKVRDGPVEGVALAQVAADFRRFAGAGMGPGPCTIEGNA